MASPSKSGKPAAMHYDVEIDMSADTSHVKVLDLVGRRRRVLDVGCATGQVARILTERGCDVVGIEMDAAAAKLAAEVCEDVIIGNVEELDLAVELGDKKFDVIIAADVLEHLTDPEAVLTSLREFLAPGGYVVASIPNIAHGSVRLALLQGKFPYSDLGLLDRSHLRFFTRESTVELFERCGFVVAHIDTTSVAVDATEVTFDKDSLPEDLLEQLQNDPDALVYQFVAMAFPRSTKGDALPDLIRRLSARLRELEVDATEATRTRDLARQAEALAAANEELEVQVMASRDALVRAEGDYDRLAAHRDAVFDESGRRAQVIIDLERRVEELFAEVVAAQDAIARVAALEQELAARTAAQELAEASRAERASELDAANARLEEIYRSRLWQIAGRYRGIVDGLRLTKRKWSNPR